MARRPDRDKQSVFCSARQEFEIELEGSQTLRLLCYEKCCNKTKQSKEDGEMTDKIMAKGQIKVLLQHSLQEEREVTKMV